MRGILFVIGLFGLLLLDRPAHAITELPPGAIVVDEGAPEFVRGGPPEYWRTAAAAAGSTYHNGQLFWTLNNSATVENYAIWRLPATASLTSTYEVYVFVPGNNATTRGARYEIVHSGPTATRSVDHSVFFAEWASLGIYTFTTPATSYVYLSDATGETPGTQQVGFDAVAFVPSGLVMMPPITTTPPITSTSPVTSTPPETTAPPITDTPTVTNPISMTHAVYLPALLNGRAAQPVPTPAFLSSISRYIATLSPSAHTAMGCESGTAGQAGTIILDFGQPQSVGFGYGTLIFDYNTLASTQEIAEAAKAFARGFADCAVGSVSLNLAVGTSNYRGATTFAHGKAWAQMVNSLETWRNTQPASLAGRVTFLGANDIEPSWNTAAQTRDWVQGYASAALQPYLNYGSCDGCPSAQYPNWQPNNNWTLDDVWFVSNGSNIAKPFPEIYATGGIHAQQWHWVSLYAANVKGKAMDFAGVLTQWQACQDTNPVPCRDSGLDNTPQQGWQQMQAALNSDTRTAQLLPSPSDISWQTPAVVVSAAMVQNESKARTTIARQLTGSGHIVEDVQAALPAQEFIASNVWVSEAPSASGEVIYIFAGQARNPQLGGGLDERQGAVAILVRDANGQFNRKRTLIVRAPLATSNLRLVAEHNGILEMRAEDGRILHFDVTQQIWRD